MFNPINLPPSEHHQFSTGHSTEFGDSAKTVGEKINAGFKHVYQVLAGMGATLADEVEYVAKKEFDLLVQELDEAKAELNNVKMMVQGLGFAGLQKAQAIIDPAHTTTMSDGSPVHPATFISEPVGTIVASEPVLVVGNVDGAKPSEPKVTEL